MATATQAQFLPINQTIVGKYPKIVTVYGEEKDDDNNDVMIRAAQFGMKLKDTPAEDATVYRDSDVEQKFREGVGADYLQIGPEFNDYHDSSKYALFRKPVMIRSEDVWIKNAKDKKFYPADDDNMSLNIQKVLYDLKTKIMGGDRDLEAGEIYGSETTVVDAILTAKKDLKEELLGEGAADQLNQISEISAWLGGEGQDAATLQDFLDDLKYAKDDELKALVGEDQANPGVMGSLFSHVIDTQNGTHTVEYVAPTGLAPESHGVLSDPANNDLSEILHGLDFNATKALADVAATSENLAGHISEYEGFVASVDSSFADVSAKVGIDAVSGYPNYTSTNYIGDQDSLAAAASALDVELMTAEEGRNALDTRLTELEAVVAALLSIPE